ncbi:MAG: FAD-dependent thymidylate synthase [Proteobacteria bacterium]|jgi:flavin-dependent thymidylate synthase|nr:FAD-dependent thymidylate synthase [Pseudomonadota bacterium]
MRVVLAGYNVDAELLRRAEAAGGLPHDQLTPEVLSAAYARISRDPRPVSELRHEALGEVTRARASNRRIIFAMGHHSVAEHAVFNFDILGLSRLAIEALEHFRLCSFTEKSQRYITLDHDFVLPKEILGTPFEEALRGLVAEQARAYGELNDALLERARADRPEGSTAKLAEGAAKEDARYATILATSGQLGLTANARNLEHIVRRLSGAPLAELRELSRKLFESASAVAPSLLLFTEPSPFDTETGAELAALAGELCGRESPPSASPPGAVRLVEAPGDCDRRVAAALLAVSSRRSYAECRAAADALDEPRLRRLFEAAMRRMEFFDAPLREFEHVAFTFELVVSAACFAQLKRHRLATLSVRPYDPELGLTIPPSIAEAGMEPALRAMASRAEAVHRELAAVHPAAAPYALTNAHRRRVLATLNLRELYHFARLREDEHAQWDIRALAGEMRRAVEAVAPLGALLLCGKDSYVARYGEVFGVPPKVDPRNIG